MKIVAKKDFANVKQIGLTVNSKSDGFVHANHIHKGYRFEIGKGEIYEDLTENDKGIITRLVYQAQVAVLDNDKNKAIIAKIDAEVKAQAEADNLAPKPVSLAEAVAAAVANALKPAKA